MKIGQFLNKLAGELIVLWRGLDSLPLVAELVASSQCVFKKCFSLAMF